MKTTYYKGKPLSNSLNAYNFYKRGTGRSLTGDIVKLKGVEKVIRKLSEEKEELTEEEISRAESVDFTGIITSLYCSFRQCAEPELRKLSFEAIIEKDELDVGALEDVELVGAILELIQPKKE